MINRIEIGCDEYIYCNFTNVVDSVAKGHMILPRLQKLPYGIASLVYFRSIWPYDIAKTREIPIWYYTIDHTELHSV
jgi:hypothetical protein